METDKNGSLPQDLSLGPVHLRVRELDRVADFYQQAIGLSELAARGRERWLGAGEKPLLVLHGDPNAQDKPAGSTGLYHFALLHPSRSALGRSLQRLLQAQVQLQGGADHLVSEAIYLADPEGNGIELYCDRPRDQWPFQQGQVQMATDPLDWDGVLAAAGPRSEAATMDSETIMGHVHLQVSNLPAAEKFYGDHLGFNLMLRYGGSASFYSVAGYHHHLGINTWAGVGAPEPPADAIGLQHFTILLTSAQALGALSDRLKRLEVAVNVDPGALKVMDPAGNTLRVALEQNNRAPRKEE
jgi:catechol 2,3-dioxygenase